MVLEGSQRADLRGGGGAAQRRAVPLLLSAGALRGQGRPADPVPAPPATTLLLGENVSAMAITTGRIGIDEAGDVLEYVPPNVVELSAGAPGGPSVSYGEPQPLAEGAALPVGFWEVQSGTVEAVGGAATIRQVIIEGG